MTRRPPERWTSAAFAAVEAVGLTLLDVEAATRYDGSPMLTLGGCFMAGLATHPSAEPDTLVVRIDAEGRELLLADAPETYYVTDHYRKHGVVLVRLSRVNRDALRDLLLVSRRLTSAKSRGGGSGRRGSSKIGASWAPPPAPTRPGS